MKHIGDGMPLDRIGAWLYLATLLGHWQLRGYRVWAVDQLCGNEVNEIGGRQSVIDVTPRIPMFLHLRESVSGLPRLRGRQQRVVLFVLPGND